MLEAVVTAQGATGRAAAVPHYRVAGKTGTGQVINNGGPVPGEVASFIGITPADAPRYVIAVFAHTPAGGGGGAVAAPTFAEMMQYTLLHYRVAPTGSKAPRPHLPLMLERLALGDHGENVDKTRRSWP
jgi:cell division protein FtsI (penicillin-binding protein 3)